MNHLDEKDLLARALRERAGDVTGQPVSFQAVRGSASRVQRRRRMITGAVAAAVATVALPTGIAVMAALADGAAPERPIIADTPTATPTPTPQGGVVPLRLDGVNRGGDPGIAYLDGDRLVLPDAEQVQLSKVYSEIAPTGDGWVALASREGEYVRDLLDADGKVLDSLSSTSGLVTNLDGSRVAYTQVENGQWNVFDVLVDMMDPRSPYNSDNERVQAVGYAGDGVLVYNAGEGEDVEARVFEPSAEDREVPAEPRLMGASAASEATGMVAGQTESLDDGSCWAAVRHDTGAPAFETCDHSLGQFSPDGRHLIGTDAYGDGLGPRTLALLDATTGDAAVTFEPPRDQMLALGDMAWEDDEHVLATVTVGLESHTVRFGLDGSMELASGRYLAEEYDVLSPVRFVARP